MSQAIASPKHASPKHLSSKHASTKQPPAPGSIDTSFGVDGFVYLEEPGNAGRYPLLEALASDNDHDFIYAIMILGDVDLAMCRLHGASGEIDTSFGDMDGHKGYTRLPYAPWPYFPGWNHIVVADNASTIVLGYALDNWGNRIAPIACRVLQDGTVDTSFGEDGLGYYPIPAPPLEQMARRSSGHRSDPGKQDSHGAPAASSVDQVHASRLADGSLLFLATLYPEDLSYLLKIDANGQLDPSFAGTGYLLVGNPAQPINAFQTDGSRDGKVLLAGSAGPDVGLVMRYESRGYLDITFGIGGRVEIVDPAWGCTCRGVSIAADGKILVLAAMFGEGFPLRHQVAGVLRLDRNGKRDGSFNNGELAFVDMAPDLFIGWQLAVDEGTRPVIGGYRFVVHGNLFTTYPMLARFLGDGRPDHAFGSNGVSEVISPDGEEAYFLYMAAQRTTKILVEGLAPGARPYLARVNG
jgi:uncharacterized delta-60 repeat protein